MNRLIYILISDGFEEIETITTFDILKRAKIDVKIISIEDKNKIIGAHSLCLLADTSLSSITVDEKYDGIALPGGIKNAEYCSQNSLLLRFINKSYINKKLIAAICAIPALVLQNENLPFKNAKMTCFPDLKQFIPSKSWENKNTVYDSYYNLITSQGPGTSINFALKIVELLCGNKIMRAISSQLILPHNLFHI